MNKRVLFELLQLRKRLWAKPLLYCLLAVAAAFLAQIADRVGIAGMLPEVSKDTVQTLLSVISTSMLAVATFAVGSMVSAYSSASGTATPRTLDLVLADDVSQNALSSFIGAFIFSIVATVALKTGYYGKGGVFVLFVLTLAVFGWVIFTFVRWVDTIARLGRMGPTIDKTEAAAVTCLEKRCKMPFLGGIEKTPATSLDGARIFSGEIGYVQYIDMASLQSIAEKQELRIMIDALPGTFVSPGRPVAILSSELDPDSESLDKIVKAFVMGASRTFDTDPRFCLIVLSEIAARALSPAVNDPGTAIAIIGRFVRLFTLWSAPLSDADKVVEKYDRVIVPSLALSEMFDDAFTAVARDGAGMVEVGIRLQKAFLALSTLDYPGMAEQSRRHSGLALERAEKAMAIPKDLAELQRFSDYYPTH